ncbi:nucleotide-diphospho-sugar transferase [Stereum hirsutum FP-91666 SS1]|uniref:nucleotide-diphospho-sugar transferase n=1 Tax=Stereum hirsutum (strain FP-91666) TaxID=721885 RepID=UPI0004449688|nr:nucleotide-diphospho-sugar transferase [Stereum hirsutum FP-91666 SS1]EIM82719.1 nucleotide-diphospho-sugar transferase [Stereum hirsutum FP-91666 SS1]
MSFDTSGDSVPLTDNFAYDFTPTEDWFSVNINSWKAIFPFVTSPSPRILEIGSWEGRSAVFLLTELCKTSGEIVCVDHFDLQCTEAGCERYRKLTHNLSLTRKTFRVVDDFSVPGLMLLLQDEIAQSRESIGTEPGFDWVHFDGTHEVDDTFLDGELAWRLARKGAIFIFDEYDWDAEPNERRYHQKRGMDAFLALHAGEYNLLSCEGQHQIILQKTVEMRIGFLLKDKESEKMKSRGAQMELGRGMGREIYMAYCVDPTYAMQAAVSIRSLAKNTPGRITVYIVSFGLTEEDKEAIRNSVLQRDDLTILFLEPSEDSFAKLTGMGPLWGKLALADIIPAERVLYIDADTLVRGDITSLWATDLRNKMVAAASDVGFPTGCNAEKDEGYFNAGVLVMDLIKIRARSAEIERACSKGTTPCDDQDVANDLFASTDDILELSLRWSTQGLGIFPFPDRQSRDSSAIDFGPVIVHITEPLEEVSKNPYVQPYVAKTWGDAWVPGHPYAQEWWDVLGEMTWKGWKVSV